LKKKKPAPAGRDRPQHRTSKHVIHDLDGTLAEGNSSGGNSHPPAD
jgi:hypothetical protein